MMDLPRISNRRPGWQQALLGLVHGAQIAGRGWLDAQDREERRKQALAALELHRQALKQSVDQQQAALRRLLAATVIRGAQYNPDYAGDYSQRATDIESGQASVRPDLAGSGPLNLDVPRGIRSGAIPNVNAPSQDLRPPLMAPVSGWHPPMAPQEPTIQQGPVSMRQLYLRGALEGIPQGRTPEQVRLEREKALITARGEQTRLTDAPRIAARKAIAELQAGPRTEANRIRLQQAYLEMGGAPEFWPKYEQHWRSGGGTPPMTPPAADPLSEAGRGLQNPNFFPRGTRGQANIGRLNAQTQAAQAQLPLRAAQTGVAEARAGDIPAARATANANVAIRGRVADTGAARQKAQADYQRITAAERKRHNVAMEQAKGKAGSGDIAGARIIYGRQLTSIEKEIAEIDRGLGAIERQARLAGTPVVYPPVVIERRGALNERREQLRASIDALLTSKVPGPQWKGAPLPGLPGKNAAGVPTVQIPGAKAPVTFDDLLKAYPQTTAAKLWDRYGGAKRR